jgi:hypothetical protein
VVYAGIENQGHYDVGPRALGEAWKSVLERRELHCGVRGGSPGFASYT